MLSFNKKHVVPLMSCGLCVVLASCVSPVTTGGTSATESSITQPDAAESALSSQLASDVTEQFSAVFPEDDGGFYWRIKDKKDMLLADIVTTESGIQVYLDLLQSNNQYKEYFAINKLVECYNDEGERKIALEAVRPFLSSENTHLAEAAEFAVSILSNTFDNPNVYPFHDNSYLFTLFNNYSDYGSYNEIWIIKEEHMDLYRSFDDPYTYVNSILVSPDQEKVAIELGSDKSTFIQVHDAKEQRESCEIASSAKNIIAKDKDYSLYERSDFENYATIDAIHWVDSDTLACNASFLYNEDSEESIVAEISYHVAARELSYKEKQQ